MERRTYAYVGPADLAKSEGEPPPRARIASPSDVRQWIAATGQRVEDRNLTVTYVVDPNGDLWIADRHSEHVQCARGGPVLSAGEITFRIEQANVEVTAVTNQSTGFCPEPESWPQVAQALDRAGLSPPARFTTEFVFRRCEACGATNIVKDGWLECAVCQRPLPEHWNYAHG